MGSDGLFDNLYDADLEPCLIERIKRSKDEGVMYTITDPTSAATCLADKAYALSK